MGALMRPPENEANTAEKLQMKKRIEKMNRLELQIRVIFLEGFIIGVTGNMAPVSST